MIRRPLVLAALALSGVTSACYRYSPLQLGELEPGMELRVQVSGAGIDRLRAGPEAQSRLVAGFTVIGTVSRIGRDSLLLSVPTTALEANALARTHRADLALLRSELRLAELRSLDRGRTRWTAAAVGAGVVASVALAIQRGGRGGGKDPGPPDNPEMRIPLSVLLRLR